MMRIEVKNYNKQAKNSISAHAQYLTERSIAAHAAHNVREREGEAPRDDLIEMGHRHMPAWAQGTEMTYWKMADKYSKVNACLGKELLITLPYELSPTDNLRLVETFLARLPKVPTTFALHAPPTPDGQRTQYTATFYSRPDWMMGASAHHKSIFGGTITAEPHTYGCIRAPPK